MRPIAKSPREMFWKNSCMGCTEENMKKIEIMTLVTGQK